MCDLKARDVQQTWRTQLRGGRTAEEDDGRDDACAEANPTTQWRSETCRTCVYDIRTSSRGGPQLEEHGQVFASSRMPSLTTAVILIRILASVLAPTYSQHTFCTTAFSLEVACVCDAMAEVWSEEVGDPGSQPHLYPLDHPFFDSKLHHEGRAQKDSINHSFTRFVDQKPSAVADHVLSFTVYHDALVEALILRFTPLDL